MAKGTTISDVIAIIRAELHRHRAETQDKHPDPKPAPARDLVDILEGVA